MIVIENTSQDEVPKISFKNVSFSWPGGKEHVINNCSFSINSTTLSVDQRLISDRLEGRTNFHSELALDHV